MKLQKVIPSINKGDAGREDDGAGKKSEFEELKRLQVLDEYQILDEEAPKEFDSITRLASYICLTPIALITFVDQDTQRIKASVGIDIDQTPRQYSFCQYTIQSDGVLEVPDTLNDQRFCGNPYVAGGPNLRFYAGAPLIAAGGYRLGSLCVIGYQPKTLDDHQKEALQILAAQVVSHLEIKRKNEELKRVLSRYQQFHDLFNSSKDLHCILNKEGEIRYVNDSVVSCLGYTAEEVLGRNIWEFCEEGTRNQVLPEIEAALLAGETRFEVETTVITKSNEVRYFSWCHVIHEEYRLISGRDITAEKKARQELIKTREEALQLSKAKESLLSMMSHEIRTPLNAVIGLTHVLLDDDPTPSQLENLNLLKFSAENLLSLLNDILDFTKIETGKLQLESIDLNLKELVSSTISSLQFKAGEKGNRLYAEVDPDIPDFVKGDHTRLYQILINLIGNSIKFTSNGTVKLKLILISRNTKSIKIRFEVSDTGIGIPADKTGYIFEAYTQAGADISRKYGGTGLGLAITKKLLHLHHSDIHVESTVGKGSDFIFMIDFETSDLEKKKKTPANQPGPIKAAILVVDDNEINRFLAKKVLEKAGMIADFASTGEEAVKKVAGAVYDLVFMDIHMPGIDGFEATRQIRQLENGKYRDLPVIALTASIPDPENLEVEKSGMNDFIFKPFVPEQLYSKIRTYVHKD